MKSQPPPGYRFILYPSSASLEPVPVIKAHSAPANLAQYSDSP